MNEKIKCKIQQVKKFRKIPKMVNPCQKGENFFFKDLKYLLIVLEMVDTTVGRVTNENLDFFIIINIINILQDEETL